MAWMNGIVLGFAGGLGTILSAFTHSKMFITDTNPGVVLMLQLYCQLHDFAFAK